MTDLIWLKGDDGRKVNGKYQGLGPRRESVGVLPSITHYPFHSRNMQELDKGFDIFLVHRPEERSVRRDCRMAASQVNVGGPVAQYECMVVLRRTAIIGWGDVGRLLVVGLVRFLVCQPLGVLTKSIQLATVLVGKGPPPS